jgi:uncharacterized protein (DUF2062 family)
MKAGVRVLTENPKTMIVVPTYNHDETLLEVVQGALAAGLPVCVVDDGSEPPAAQSLAGLDVELVRHSANLGKGKAILSGAARARELGMTHIITMDADGQHLPQDLHRFTACLDRDPMAIWVGIRDMSSINVPFISRFGCKFSNFWLRVQTGSILNDVQCGFRLYPLEVLSLLKLKERRYSFEVEVLVRASWAGFRIGELPIKVHYPEQSQRVSHFNKLWDNLLISWLNTRLTFRSIMPWPHKKYIQTDSGKISALHPMQSIRILLSQDETPARLGWSAALGIVLGALPLIALHSVAIILAAGYLRLSKITALALSQLCIPPLVPALCIEIGHFLRHGVFLTNLSIETLGYQAMDRLWEWTLGSLIAAPVLGILVGLLVYFMARMVQAELSGADENAT